MFTTIKAADRYHFATDWLDTKWHFSFGHYIDEANLNFGPLRVFNDDVVQPDGGFPMHKHAEMEIITYVLSGALEHKDSTGGHGVLNAGDAQRMSAGRGILHSEFNPSQTEPVHLLQLWIMPAQHGVKPDYEQRPIAPAADRWTVVASGRPDANGAMRIKQDAAIYVAKPAAGTTLTHTLAAGRRAYVFVMAGSVTVNDHPLATGDQARITDVADLALTATADAHVMLIDLP